MSDGMDGLDGLSYTAVTPRASLQSDANNVLGLSSWNILMMEERRSLFASAKGFDKRTAAFNILQ